MTSMKSQKALQEKLDELETSGDETHIAEEIEGEVEALKTISKESLCNT